MKLGRNWLKLLSGTEDEDDDVRRSACEGIMCAINGTIKLDDLPRTEYVIKIAFHALFDNCTIMNPWLQTLCQTFT